jgi:uncharacterized OsmC-like protein
MAGNKSWSIKAVSNEGAALSFYRQSEALFVGGARAVPISPVEHLLTGAAGCLALSCRAVMAEGQRSAASVEVTATGYKAAEPPSRLGRIELAVRFGKEIDEADARSIVEEAEKLCTVTNTLLGSHAIEIAIDSSRGPAAAEPRRSNA